ncbi:lasso peptide biosynthesis B2 protein [Sphingomonas sp.]|uniref:lasso peptide biosynthesis B2 protein n=1 Tax=Sphingomonas sp. TaxID=28214 RepID=UPI00286D9F21|nr:lasso peptide biosynthesis B2 protein [Sphingomonas sp.]
MLAVAAVAIRLASFRRLAGWIRRPKLPLVDPPAGEIERVRRAIDAWTRRLPWPPKCFARGLAAVWMLHRRGIVAHLSYGAATIAGTLKAHVWVRVGEIDVVGCDDARDYALLAQFPS